FLCIFFPVMTPGRSISGIDVPWRGTDGEPTRSAGNWRSARGIAVARLRAVWSQLSSLVIAGNEERPLQGRGNLQELHRSARSKPKNALPAAEVSAAGIRALPRSGNCRNRVPDD